MCFKKLLAWGQPGVEPGTARTRSENHIPTPLSLWEKVKLLRPNIFLKLFFSAHCFAQFFYIRILKPNLP